MGKYTIFSDVSKTIVDLLKAELVPEPLAKAENIGVCAPNERGNFIVGIHLYDFKENREMGFDLPPIILPNGYIQQAPVSYQLSYLISVSSKAEAIAKGIEEARILGRILQIFNDNKTLPSEYMPEPLRASGEPINITMLPLELEEKIKIWTMFNEPYKQSAFFNVNPVLLESAVSRPPATRVREVILGSEQKDRETGR